MVEYWWAVQQAEQRVELATPSVSYHAQVVTLKWVVPWASAVVALGQRPPASGQVGGQVPPWVQMLVSPGLWWREVLLQVQKVRQMLVHVQAQS